MGPGERRGIGKGLDAKSSLYVVLHTDTAKKGRMYGDTHIRQRWVGGCVYEVYVEEERNRSVRL